MGPNFSFEEYLDRLKQVGGIDVALVSQTAQANLAFLHGTKAERHAAPVMPPLQVRWYASVDRGWPDYGIYDGDEYLGELWACWQVCSRKYLHAIQSPKCLPSGSIVADIGAVHSVVDLGCGCGQTSAMLSALFPGAAVFGTNLRDTTQWRVAASYARDYNFTLVQDVTSLPVPAGLVFASEFFEHLEDPIPYLWAVLALQPSHLLIANAFNAEAIGHFRTYRVNGRRADGRETSRAFNAVLREAGYTKQNTALWNNRPSYWKRTQVSSQSLRQRHRTWK